VDAQLLEATATPPDYQAIAGIRHKAANSRLILVEGA
jgi:uncharacterized protein (DUF1330 family)